MPETKIPKDFSRAIMRSILVEQETEVNQIADGLIVWRHHAGPRWNESFAVNIVWDLTIWGEVNLGGRKITASNRWRQLTLSVKVIEEVEGLIFALFKSEMALPCSSKWKRLTIEEVQLVLQEG